MGKILMAIMCLIGFFVSYSYAGSLKDGLSAYDKGDYKTAYKLLLMEAKRGHAKAQSRLGIMCYNGQGVLQDYKEAIKWWRLAAEQGHAAAQYILGSIYANGDGVLPDYKEAVKWWRLAAEQGVVLAKCHLAEMYAAGLGIRTDLTTAKRLAGEGFDAGEQYCEKVLWYLYDSANY